MWRDGAGNLAVWQVNAGGIAGSALLGAVDSSWQAFDTAGDYDGDGKSDILWRGAGGSVAVWLMNGASVGGGIVSPSVPEEWKLVSARGDYDDDGKSDLLWRNTAGDVAIWSMNGTAVASQAIVGSAPTNWTLVDGDGDYDGDGRSDLLWRGPGNEIAIWQMNGSAVQTSATVGVVGSEWTIVSGGGDYDGDGRSDILWRGTDGTLVVWRMNGSAVAGSGVLGAAGSEWQIQEARGDYNGDGKSDILWRDTAGLVAIWDVDGTAVTAGRTLGAAGSEWNIQTRRLTAAIPPAALEAKMEQALIATSRIVDEFGHTCILRADTTVACYGWGEYGQLGAGTGLTSSWVPVTVPGLNNVRSLHSGRHKTCAVHINGTVSCWGGRNENGPTPPSFFSPQQVPSLSDVTTLAITTSWPETVHDTVCAVKGDGTVWCWGMNYVSFPFGGLDETGADPVDGPDPVLVPLPTQVPGLADVKSIAVGGWGSWGVVGCALHRDGTVSCWGSNSDYLMGRDASLWNSSAPLPVPGLTGVVSISGGSTHTMCALKVDGALVCWGDNGRGLLGKTPLPLIGDEWPENRSPIPHPIANVTSPVAVSVGQDSACVLQSDGQVRCWGLDAQGSMGTGGPLYSVAYPPDHSELVIVPQNVAGLTSVTALAVSWLRGCVLQSNGQGYCWGGGTHGPPYPSQTSTPIQIPNSGAPFWTP